MSFWPLHLYILIISFQKITWPFSNYPSLKTFEGCNCENMKNTLKIDDFWKLVPFSKYLHNQSSNLCEIWDLFHKIVKNYLLIFCKDLCTHARTQGKNMRTRISSRQKAGTHTFMPLVGTCVHGSLQILFWSFFTILWIYVSNFIKIWAFVAEIFAKRYWLSRVHQFSMYFPYFHSYTPQKSSKMGNYWKVIEFFGN